MKPIMKKVLVKVLRNGDIRWVHFSAVPKELYDSFFRLTETEPLDLNAYLSKWCKEDFDTSLNMGKYDDIYHLKLAINERFQAEYAELYGAAGMPEIRGWVRMWLSQHMREEIAKYE
jgi:hypothetical protein